MISQWRHRRRRRDDDDDAANDQESGVEQNLSASLHEGRKKRQSCCSCRNRQRTRIGVLTIAAAFVSIHLIRNTLVRKAKDIERYLNNSVRDKHARGMLFLPLRYLRVKWIDPLPTHERKFVMKYNSTFVVNLELDRERWVAFQRANQKRMKDIQRIPATLIHGELPLTQKQSKDGEQKGAITEGDAEDAEELKTQQMYFDHYPALQYLAKHEGMGTAACSLTHLRLFQYLLDQDAHDYMFVFEDDIEILDPLLDSGAVVAPNNADLILLSEASLGHVSVSWRKKGGIRATKDDKQKLSNNAIRVTSGYTTWGYIITKRGARIILDEYKHERTEPIDIYFFKNPNLKIYLPTSDWPAVTHGKLGIKSTRRQRDD
mmetsp:Transcript_24749/g.52504  ORF Transcript_24749/g.52504 Transcript_24749/m.52504 type:complete len:374 (-) Transcript_24749:117-1238(-)